MATMAAEKVLTCTYSILPREYHPLTLYTLSLSSPIRKAGENKSQGILTAVIESEALCR